MKVPADRVLFDQYSRYRAVADVLQELIGHRDRRKVRVLDVGSGVECLLGTLLPGVDVCYVDPLLAGDDRPGVIGDSAFSPRLEGERFDMVVCVDTLEHFWPQERPRLLRRLAQLAEEAVVVAGPCRDAGDAIETDRWLNDAYRRFQGRDFPWLKEHFEFGLPSRDETVESLEQLGWRSRCLGNGHTPWMRELLTLVLCALENPDLMPVALDLSRDFNRCLYPFDALPPVYRLLVVARRGDAGARPLAREKVKLDAKEAERRWQSLKQRLMVDPLVALSKVERVEPASAATPPERSGESTRSLVKAVQHLSSGFEIERMRYAQRLSELQDQVASLHQDVAASRSERRRLAQELARNRSRRDDLLERRDQELAELRMELDRLRSSRLWRFGHRYWSVLRAIGLGQGSEKGGKAASPSWRRSVPPQAQEGTGYDVFCLPVIDWGFRFQRPQQLCRRMARAGHRVFYLDTKLAAGAERVRWRTIEKCVYGLRLPAGRAHNLYQDTIDPPEAERMANALSEFHLEVGLRPAVCLVDLPFWAPLAEEMRKRWNWRLVYDCMDDHSGFATNHPEMLRREEALIRSSDLVVTSSQRLFDGMIEARRRVLVRNGADFEHFSDGAAASAVQGSSSGEVVVGYFGAISEWFDVEMVAKAAQLRPQWTFRLIGSTFGANCSALRGLANVELLGEKPYESLPGQLADFDVALIPFRIMPLTLATNPVKFYEYLSAGKPVVATPLPELEQYRDYFYPAESGEELVRQVERALDEDSAERRALRQELASSQTWSNRYLMLDGAIRELYPKVLVVVVSYRNLEFLRLCLASLWSSTDYPDFEVLVVDNASGPEVVGFLREQAESHPRLRLILNDENVGFPRANNQALAERGDASYVVLLNDDTVVTHGWLTGLIRHLEKDPDLGMVGPQTNAIGNEAQIDVPYRDIDEMKTFALDHSRQRVGRVFEIPVLAMFCVAIRAEILDRIGLLDESFGIGMFEDDDFCKRIRAEGFRLVCAEDVFVHHWGKSSFKRLDADVYRRLFEENRRRFEDKWGQPWQPHRRRSG